MSQDIQDIIARAAAEGDDYNQATKGGGGGPACAEGPAVAVLVGYIETGMHPGEYKGKAKAAKPTCTFIFELRSAKHSTEKREDGSTIINTLKYSMNIDRNEKAGFYKLFKQLNRAGNATHPAQLLGKHWLVKVSHEAWKSDPAKISATIKQDGAWAFSPAVRTTGDALVGDLKETPIACPTPLSQIKLFLWEYANLKQWDDIFIDGEWENDDGTKRSKNEFQDKIRKAVNFNGSPIQQLIEAGSLDIAPEVPEVNDGADLPDPLDFAG